MKRFIVHVDFCVANSLCVNAEDEEQAIRIAKEKITDNPYKYVGTEGDIAGSEVVDVEEDEDVSELGKALDYVRDNIDPDDLVIIRAQVDKSYSNHMAPGDCVTDDSKVIDLLEEYGQDNDLPEGWWEEYGDINDVLLEL